MQAAIATLERELGLAREVIMLLAAELPPGRLLEPRLHAALELSLTPSGTSLLPVSARAEAAMRPPAP